MKTNKIKEWVIGAPLDPLKPETRHSVALVAFLAWIGLGADGLSSSTYGPEEAFLALGEHTHLGLYLAIATAATVFIISLAYNQVIELFPSGGGGYKVASQLLGSRAGLVSGAALLVDYVLTIAISIASGVDALFSLLPPGWRDYKLAVGMALVVLLIVLNLRGMKESIGVLLPIFLGFFVTHVGLIVYGVWAHAEAIPAMLDATLQETVSLSSEFGWMFVAALFLKAYSLGGGTYTGLEAVSNNVNTLAEPRVRTGKLTMLYMAVSLSFTAGGIILLYLLWDAAHVPGQTLNAVVFQSIIASWNLGDSTLEQIALWALMALEAGLLMVAANTGFLGGPAVLANMAVDSWVPRHFRSLSARLVTQNGIVLMGLAALAILMWSHGAVKVLVVLYSINVFLTFTLALAGLVKHWWQSRHDEPNWRWRLALSLLGVGVTGSILAITVVEKFTEGGWMTVLITSAVVALCLATRRHYDAVRSELKRVDALLAPPLGPEDDDEPRGPALEREAPTAVFLVGKNRGVGMHTLLWVQRMFPGHFRNFVFLSVGEVDSHSFHGQGALRSLHYQIDNSLHYFTRFCHREGLAAEGRAAYGADPVDELEKLTLAVMRDYPNSVCFASKLILRKDSWITPWLHNQTALAMQRRLHLNDRQMVVIPLKV